MKHLITLALVAAFAIAPLAAQQMSGNGGVPMHSPEPITMIALAGGAAIAGGLASRRRKNK